VRREPPRHALPPKQASRIRRLPGRWLAAVLITGTAALLAPGVSYATANLSASAAAPASAASVAAPASAGCRGVTPASLPARGFISNPARTQAGHLWWRPSTAGVCIGTVVEWVRYNATATKTWKVIVYSAQHPNGQVVAQRAFTLARGWYFWGFGVHRAYPGLSAVCLTADGSFGVSCIHFGRSQG
jgi:hypothetical protein